MFVSFLIALSLAMVCAAGWALCELELRDKNDDLNGALADLDVALGWHEKRTVENAVVHTTLHVIEGGE